LILKNIRRHFSISTIVVVSHRLSTLSTFQRVLLFAGGRIVRDGSPEGLIWAPKVDSHRDAADADNGQRLYL
jgi:ABC-type multidrug transport system fused ATPase/permease subunit